MSQENKVSQQEKITAITLIKGSNFESKLEEAWPKNASMLCRAMINFIRLQDSKNKNNSLMNCTPESMADCLMSLALTQLVPSVSAGLVYLIPYGNIATLTISYRGLMQVAMRGDKNIDYIKARIVHKGDDFLVEEGTAPSLSHTPKYGDTVTHSYAIVFFSDGRTPRFDVMTRKDIDKAKSCSKSPNGPWKMWYEEMAKKSIIRRLFKWLPVRGGAQVLEAGDLNDGVEFNDNAIETDSDPLESMCKELEKDEEGEVN